MIGPVPGYPKGPEQLDKLPDIPGSRPNQIGGKEHLKEHEKEKDEKPIAEGFGAHPPGGGPVAGEPQTASQQTEKLPPVAVTVTVQLTASKDGDQ